MPPRIRTLRPSIIRNLTSLTTYTPIPPPVPPPIIGNSMLLYSIPTSPKSPTPSPQEQTRRANLGHMVSYLRSIIPEALHKLPDSKYLDENIILRVAPSVTSLPILKGRVSYLATLRATQFIMANLVLNKGVKLHIRAIDIQKGVGGVTNFCSNLQDEEKGIRQGVGYGLYDWTTKLVIKWRTCEDGCDHLLDGGEQHSTGFAKKSGIILEKFDVKKLWGGHHNDEEKERLINGLEEHDGLEECEIGGRVIHGIFVFELDQECEKIIVHNVENIEMFEKKDFVDDGRAGLASV